MGKMMDFHRGHQPKPATPATSKPAKPPKSAGPVLTYTCGHSYPAEHLTAKPCPRCKNAAREAKQQARRAQQKEQHRQAQRSRLPQGARFELTYDAEAILWTGTLAIPGCPVFTATHSGSVRCQFALDDLYRQWLAAAEAGQSQPSL